MKKCTLLYLAPAAALLSANLAFAGSVKGRITFAGAAPKGDAVKMNADPKCAAQYSKPFLFAPVVVSPKGELANVFVYVKKGLEGKKFTPPAESKAILDQKGCWYHPRVSGIMVGQKLQIINSDPTMHNVNAMPEFNAAMPLAVKRMEKTFKKPRVMFKIKCNVHPWMTTYVGVLEHPYYAVSGENGGFEIKDLPSGKYTLEAWHEKLGSQSMDVTVGEGPAAADFKFAGKASAKS